MGIQSLCKTDVVTVERTSTLRDVANLMQRRHVGSVVVTESFNGRRIPAGIVTDRDIALSLGSSQKPQELRVEQIMQGQLVVGRKSDGLYEIILKMREHGVKRLPVVNEDGSLYGILSSDDLLNLMSDEVNNLAKIGDNQLKREMGIKASAGRSLRM